MRVLRRPGTVSSVVFFGVVLTFGAANVFAPEWSRGAGLDVWNLPSLNEELKQAIDQRAGVTAQEEHSVQRREIANHIVLKFENGYGLSEAVDELMEVFQNEEGMILTLRGMYPNTTNIRQLLARHAIDRFKRITPESAQCKTTVARLEAEFATLDGSATARAH